MAYKIQYSPESASRYPQLRKKLQLNWASWLPWSLLLAGILWLRLYGVPDFLIPGDPDITRAAAAEMVGSIRAGSSAEAAVTVFCKEILHGAGF